MTVKKKAPHPSAVVEEASSSLEESVMEEERKTPITQVVEIIDDNTPVEDTKPSVEESSSDIFAKAKQSVSDTDTNDTAYTQNTDSIESDEKRKELVDELFQKKPVNSMDVMPEITAHHATKKNPIIYWAIGIVSACVVIAVSLVLFSGKKLSLPSVVVVPTATPTPEPKTTPSPTPVEVKKESLSIQVLNGGGKAGAATKMKKSLEAKGYTVKDTGNAEEYTYDKTEIHVKSVKNGALQMLEADLKDTYTLGTSAADLEDSVAYDVRVIVGKE